MAAERSKKLHHLMVAVLMLAMGVAQVVFAMGGEATWFPPLYFGICSVAYAVLLVVEIYEENELVRSFVDALSHIFSVLTLASLVGMVSIEFALGLLFSILSVALWYAVKEQLRGHNNNNNPTPDPADSTRSEEVHLLLLACLGGAIVFGQIALAIGVKPTPIHLTYFGVSSLVYMFFRSIDLMEDHATKMKLVADNLSRLAGVVSIVFFVGIISEEFALAILVTGITVGVFLGCRYCCTKWWSQPTAEELVDEIQSLISADEESV